jgi:hypothetical protein
MAADSRALDRHRMSASHYDDIPASSPGALICMALAIEAVMMLCMAIAEVWK